MADRTWNAVDARLYEEDWSQVAIIVMGIIIAKCPNQYGVYKLPLGFIRRFLHGVFAEDQPSIDEAIAEVAKDGAIKLYDGGVIWIVKKWGRDKYSSIKNNQKGAIDYLVLNFPNVVDDFRTKYPISGTKFIESGTKSLKTGTSDPESNPDPDTDMGKKKDKAGKSAADFPEYLSSFVHEVIQREMSTAELVKNIDALDKLARIDMPKCGDGYKDRATAEQEVFAILRFGAKDDFWKAVFNSIPRLRVNASQKFWNMRSAWQKTGEIITGIKVDASGNQDAINPATGNTYLSEVRKLKEEMKDD